MATEQRTYQDRIVQDPGIMVGKPVVKGTRIPVERVIAHLAHEPDLAGLFAAYPELTIEDVTELAAELVRLQYVIDHYRDRLDQFLVVEPNRVRIRRPPSRHA